jgi:hypothetical protein
MSSVHQVTNRKLFSHSKLDLSSRKGNKTSNLTDTKYSRNQLLSTFRPSRIPNLADPEAVEPLLSRKSLPPVHRPNNAFSHKLGSDFNSRKRGKEVKEEKLPEWFDSELPESSSQFKSDNDKQNINFEKASAPKAEENKAQVKFVLRPGANVKNLLENLQGLSLDSTEEDSDYSRIDEKYEASIKADFYEENEITPKWAEADLQNDDIYNEKDSFKQLDYLPVDALKYPVDLLQAQIKEGDPFATTILNSGSMEENGFILIFPGSKPYERVWYYKDPQNITHGPFCTLEMYNWNLGGFFSPDLLISWNSKEIFVPLKMFMLQQRMALSGIPMYDEYPAPTVSSQPPVHTPAPAPKIESCEDATFKLKSLLGII